MRSSKTGTFDHDKNFGFLLTAMSTFQQLVSLVLWEFYGEEVLIQFYLAAEQATFVTFIYNISKLAAHPQWVGNVCSPAGGEVPL